jgi:hypothetical protein
MVGGTVLRSGLLGRGNRETRFVSAQGLWTSSFQTPVAPGEPAVHSMVVCNGMGRPAVVAGVRHWRRFTCTQTIFRNGAIREITFGVRALGKLRFSVVYARYGP